MKDSTAWLIVRIFLFAVMALMISGWFVSIPDVTDLLYADLHARQTVRRVIGTILFALGTFLMMGYVDLFNLVNDFRGKHGLGRPKDANPMYVIAGNGAIIALGLVLMVG